MDVLALHARVAREFERRDFESYLELMHREVEFTTVAFGEERVFRGHESGGYLDAAGVWLLVARDGLVWRYRPVESEDDARERYAGIADAG